MGVYDKENMIEDNCRKWDIKQYYKIKKKFLDGFPTAAKVHIVSIYKMI